MITTDVENYPGFAEPIQGPWLMEQMRAQAEHVGRRIRSRPHRRGRPVQRPFRLTGNSGAGLHRRRADHRHRRQGPMAGPAHRGEIQGLRRLGLRHLRRLLLSRQDRWSWSAAAIRRSRRRCILANIASKVTLIHRRNSLRSERILQERLFARQECRNPLERRHRRDHRQREPALGRAACGCKNVKTGALDRDCRWTGVFVAIGHKPATELFAGQMELKTQRLYQDRAGFDRDQYRGRVRRGRRRRR